MPTPLSLLKYCKLLQILTLQTPRERKGKTGLRVLLFMKNAAETKQKSRGFMSGIQTSALFVVLNRR